MFPAALGFRGGKGLACLGGVILAFSGPLFVFLLSLALLIVAITKYVCFVPITISVIFPSILSIQQGSPMPLLFFFPATACIFGKHVQNLIRIRNGEEARISYLWNKDGELQRLGKPADLYDEPGEDE